MKDIDSIQKLNEQFKDSDPQKVLEYFISNYKKEIAFASSMGAEDQIITHFLSQIDKSVRIFTLDTGRLFPETYSLISRTKSHFAINIEIFFSRYCQY